MVGVGSHGDIVSVHLGWWTEPSCLYQPREGCLPEARAKEGVSSLVLNSRKLSMGCGLGARVPQSSQRLERHFFCFKQLVSGREFNPIAKCGCFFLSVFSVTNNIGKT